MMTSRAPAPRLGRRSGGRGLKRSCRAAWTRPRRQQIRRFDNSRRRSGRTSPSGAVATVMRHGLCSSSQLKLPAGVTIRRIPTELQMSGPSCPRSTSSSLWARASLVSRPRVSSRTIGLGTKGRAAQMRLRVRLSSPRRRRRRRPRTKTATALERRIRKKVAARRRRSQRMIRTLIGRASGKRGLMQGGAGHRLLLEHRAPGPLLGNGAGGGRAAAQGLEVAASRGRSRGRVLGAALGPE
mmetsp:Transcript_108540/g.242071  ORF Transcript_108540/g.242071 Transcript_108540/m.242071 type:complete len:240 (+) Transcript_108540:707-1426(+)